jgi:hypothetical protein
LYQKKLKVIFRNNLKKNIEKKWCEWCESCDYQQVIPKNSTKMVQEWCKVQDWCGIGGRGRRGVELLLLRISGI